MFDTGIVSTTTGDGASSNGFISMIEGAFGAGLNKVATEVLPNWTAQQLGVQQNPILDNPVINTATAPPRADSIAQPAAAPAEIKPVLWDTVQKNYNVSSGAVLAAGAVLLGLVIFLKIAR